MPTNKQRREAARRHLERQLARREEQAATRKRRNMIASVIGTVVVVAVLALVLGLTLSSDHGKKANAGSTSSVTPTSTATSPTPTPTPSVNYSAATGPAVTFDGVTVKGAADLHGYPVVTSKSAKSATKLEIKDLVVGKGAAATPSSTVTVQYYGVLYKNGTYFDSSWKRGMPAQFALTQVVPGFTQGIGGTTGIPPMHVGGRRIIIVPAALGYGSQANGSIPANSTLVFIVDLVSVP